MKSRRNFVVEIKSNRRQIRPQATSIWGDTDLKAISRDVENELPMTGSSLSLEKTRVVQVSNDDNGDTEQSTEILPIGELPRRMSASRIIQAMPQINAEPEANQIPSPSLTELAELEAENRRLKGILRSQLQAENRKLREMLAHLP